MKSLAIVLAPNVMLSAVFGIKEIIELYNNYCKKAHEERFESIFVSTQKEKNFLGFTCESIFSKRVYDMLLVPPLAKFDPECFHHEALKEWLVFQYHQGALLSSACVGSFYLAHTGLLKQKKATTHWAYEKAFKESFPEVELVSSKILVDEQKLITAAGVSAYMDLTLYLLEKFSSYESVNMCANILLVEQGRESQQCYKNLSSQLLVKDESLKTLLVWMQKNLHKNQSNTLLAKRLAVSEKTLTRRFNKELACTPKHYLQQLRIQRAKELLVSTQKSFFDITYAVGFSNESSFRRLFKREVSLNPGEYRKKFARK